MATYKDLIAVASNMYMTDADGKTKAVKLEDIARPKTDVDLVIREEVLPAISEQTLYKKCYHKNILYVKKKAGAKSES